MNRLRQLKKSDWIAIALAGVLILIIAMPLSPKQSESGNTAGQETAGAVSDSGSTQGSQNAYAAALERRLKQVLGQMEGVENGSEKQPYVTKEVLPKVEGVLVVAEGGDDPRVISDISDTVMALFRVEAHKIKVVKMSSSRE